MSLWARVHDWFEANAKQLTLVWFPGEDGAVAANRDYFRLWLDDMFLAKSRAWGTEQQPAVHASVRMRLGGREATELTLLARPPEKQMGPGVRVTFPVTPLLPYSGGVVELEAGLSAVPGGDSLAAAFRLVQGLSRQIGPPLTQALDVAGALATGINEILDASGGQIALGLHRSFVAPRGPREADEAGDVTRAEFGPVLEEGHLACVSAPAGTFTEGQLSVRDGRLHRGTKPLEGYDYIVFRIERREERDDWRVPDIEDLIGRAIDASLAGDAASFEAFRNAACAKALKSPDLTVPDRRRVARSIREELADIEDAGRGVKGEEAPTLAKIIERHAAAGDRAAKKRGLTLEQVLAET